MESQNRKVLHYTLAGKDLFDEWLAGLGDISGRTAVVKRLKRVEGGNFGDHRSVGDGVWELRIDFGPGYRIYYGEDGPVIVLLICGGDKQSQRKDIRLARRLWQEYKKGI
jgi:putative addiction module killer protein